MTLDDLYAAPVVGANRHAFGLFGNMRPSTQEEIDAYSKALADMGFPYKATASEIATVIKRMERQMQIEYDEWIVATPKNLTSDDYAENHAAGLPITREHIVRCKDCRWSQDAPKVEEYHLECILRPLSRHYTRDEDFCSHGEPK